MNETVMKDAFGQLDQTAISFICKEFSLTKKQFKEMTEDQLDELYEKLCDVETDEIPEGSGSATERGEMAASIVTIVGNYFAEKLGYDDGDDFDRFLSEEDSNE